MIAKSPQAVKISQKARASLTMQRPYPLRRKLLARGTKHTPNQKSRNLYDNMVITKPLCLLIAASSFAPPDFVGSRDRGLHDFGALAVVADLCGVLFCSVPRTTTRIVDVSKLRRKQEMFEVNGCFNWASLTIGKTNQGSWMHFPQQLCGFVPNKNLGDLECHKTSESPEVQCFDPHLGLHVAGQSSAGHFLGAPKAVILASCDPEIIKNLLNFSGELALSPFGNCWALGIFVFCWAKALGVDR